MSSSAFAGQTAAIPAVNYLINGGFRFCQRTDPATPTTVQDWTYSADRWKLQYQDSVGKYSRGDTNATGVETGLTTRFYGKWSGLLFLSKYLICQPLEGDLTAALSGTALTFYCKLKSNASRTLRLGVIFLGATGVMDTIPNLVTGWSADTVDPVLDSHLGYITSLSPASGASGTISGNGLSCSVGTAWIKCGVSFTIPAGAKNIIPVIWTDSALQTTDSISMAEAGLCIGTSVPLWTPLDYTTELRQCERYYEKTYDVDTKPGTPATGSSIWPFSISASEFYCESVMFRTTKRILPGVHCYDSMTGAANSIYDLSNSTTYSVALSDGGQNGFRAKPVGVPANHLFLFQYTAEAEL